MENKSKVKTFLGETELPLIERKGDWTCPNCHNLNFAFRQQCNRCHLAKSDNPKIIQKFMSYYNNNN